MNAYCYYEDLGANHLEHDVIKAWETSWRNNGWNPIALGRETAMKHPGYSGFLAAVRKFPTVNPYRYELACYRRHLAMVMVDGGMLTDYDIINVRYRPEDLPALDDEIQSLDQSGAPAPAFGTRKAWESLVNFLQSYTPEEGATHVSDMLILQHFIKRRHPKISLTLFEDGWKAAPMIHFQNAAVVRLFNGVRRSDLIKSTLAEIGIAPQPA